MSRGIGRESAVFSGPVLAVSPPPWLWNTGQPSLGQTGEPAQESESVEESNQNYQVRPGDSDSVRHRVRRVGVGGSRCHGNICHPAPAVNIRLKNLFKFGSVLRDSPAGHSLNHLALGVDDDHGGNRQGSPVSDTNIHHVDPVDGQETSLHAHVQNHLLTY